MNKSPFFRYEVYVLSALPLVAAIWILSVTASAGVPKRQRVEFRGADKVPAEIWREILIYAYGDQTSLLRDKELHDSGDCRCDDKFTFGWPSDGSTLYQITYSAKDRESQHDKERAEFLRSYREKLNIARVSRMHWEVAAELLYQDLRVYDTVSAVALALYIASSSSLMGRATLTWAKQLRVDLIGSRILSTEVVTDAVSCIMYCCPQLRAISIRALPDWRKPAATWCWCWRKVMRHIPTHVELLDTAFHSYQSPSAQLVIPLDACELDRPPTFPRLSLLRTEAILGAWMIPSLTHLYITHLWATRDHMQDQELWKVEKPQLTVLHLGSEVVAGQKVFELLLAGMPNLRVFEYHYIDPWPIDAWYRCQIPSSLRRITVKTFADADPRSAILFYELTAENWNHFLNHLLVLFVHRLKPREDGHTVSVVVILPGFKERVIGSDVLVQCFENFRAAHPDCPGRFLVKVQYTNEPWRR